MRILQGAASLQTTRVATLAYGFVTLILLTPGLRISAAEVGTTEELQRPQPDSPEVENSSSQGLSEVESKTGGKNQTFHRKLHGAWLKGLDDNHQTRKLAQAPGSARISGTCSSVTCGGVCCDALYTYGSSLTDPCTVPLPTCSASGQCQSQPQLQASVCVGLRFGFQSYPGNAAAISASGQLGFSCPASAINACSYLNTYSYDRTVCTQGACIPTLTGGLNCIPVIQGLDKFGCVAAIQTFTAAQATIGGAAALSG